MTSAKDWSPKGHQYFYIAMVGGNRAPIPFLFSFPRKLEDGEFELRWIKAVERVSDDPEWIWEDVIQVLEKNGFILLESEYVKELD